MSDSGQKTLQVITSASDNKEFYNMDHKLRSKAIINLEFSDDLDLDDRESLQNDADDLAHVLRGLGFHVYPLLLP